MEERVRRHHTHEIEEQQDPQLKPKKTRSESPSRLLRNLKHSSDSKVERRRKRGSKISEEVHFDEEKKKKSKSKSVYNVELNGNEVEVAEGVFVVDASCINDEEDQFDTLSRLNITNVLCIVHGNQPASSCESQFLHLLQNNTDLCSTMTLVEERTLKESKDQQTEAVEVKGHQDYLCSFPSAHQFILKSREDDGSTLIYTSTLGSSPYFWALCISLIMLDTLISTGNNDPKSRTSGAMSHLQRVLCNGADLNVLQDESLRSQLRIWESMGNRIDVCHPKWIRYKALQQKVSEESVQAALEIQEKNDFTKSISMTPTIVSSSVITRTRGDSASASPLLKRIMKPTEEESDSAMSRTLKTAKERKSLNVDGLPNPNQNNPGYSCKKCNKLLFNVENVIVHKAEGFQENYLNLSKCKYIAIEPMQWMGENVLQKEHSSYACPGCKTVVGEFSWDKIRCSCGETLSPAFFISKKKLVYITNSLSPTNCEPEETERKRSLSASMARGMRKLLSSDNLMNLSRERAGSDLTKEIQASCFQELPKEIQKVLLKAKIREDDANANWPVVVYLVSFNLKRTIQTPHFSYDPVVPELPEGVTQAEEALAKKIGSSQLTNTFGLISRYNPDFVELMKEKLLNSEYRDRFKLMEKCGKGGFGRVHIAKDLQTKEQVAIKRMPARSSKDWRNALHEIAVLKAVKHANIVSYKCSFQVKDEIWVVMEYMEGGTITDAYNSWTFTERQVAYIAKSMLQGLQYLHENGLTHRDIKSQNVMLTTQGTVKLIDFGLCSETIDLVRKPRMVGSPYWMPPEIILHQPHGPHIDIWSFGICILELVEKRAIEYGSAFKAMWRTATEGKPNPFMNPDFHSSQLRHFITSVLKKDPVDRPTAAELLKHPFLRKPASHKDMQGILGQIFIQQVFNVGGL